MKDFNQQGFAPTSGFRTQRHQDALVAQGLTKTGKSQHTAGNAIDFSVPQGWTKQKAIQWVKQKYPAARVEATNGNSIHVTFPGWGGAPDVSNSRKRYK